MASIANAAAKRVEKIDVTPAMIEEGAAVLAFSAETFAHHPFELLKPIVAEVYRSMALIGLKGSGNRHSASKCKDEARRGLPRSDRH